MINFFSSALVFLSLRRTADEGGRPTVGITRLLLVVAGVLFDVEATDASLSLEDSPGEALRFLRFLRGLPFSFGAEKLHEDVEYHRDRNVKNVLCTFYTR